MNDVLFKTGVDDNSVIGKRVRILPSSQKSWAIGKTGTILIVLEDLNAIDADPLFPALKFDILLDDMDRMKPPFGKYSFCADEFEFINEEPEKKEDMVNHPSHYTDGKYEVIDFIESTGIYQDFYAANAIKYICRAGKKNPDKEKEDLEKAVWYLERGKDKPVKGIGRASDLMRYKDVNKSIQISDFIDDKGLTGTLRGVAIRIIVNGSVNEEQRETLHNDVIDILKVEIKNMEVNGK